MTLRQAVDRYGAAAAVVVALGLLVLLLPSNVDKSEKLSFDGGTSNGPTTDNTTDTTLDPLAGPVTTLPEGVSGSGGGGSSSGGGSAPQGGAEVEFGKGAHCRPDARQLSIERVAPPCVNWLGKDNGGATSPGVTGDRILVVRYVAQSDPATQAILEGAQLADDPAVVKKAYDALFTYFNQHYQTYGRQVVFQDFPASGPSENEEQAKADAVKIATDIKPFAVWGGPNAFAKEIAARGIICICTVSLSDEFYKTNNPYLFGSLPTSTEYAEHVGEFVGKKLWNKPAQFVGAGFTPAQKAKRKFGLIFLEGTRGKVDPEGKRTKDAMVNALAKYGASFGAGDMIGYTYDPGRNQQDLTTMITKLHSDGVTSVIMFADPLSPILITSEATRQAYFPEWIITGSGLSDTTSAGRLYDQNQWQHAFGISPLWITWTDPVKSYGYRQAHHGNPGLAKGDEGVLINIYSAIPRILFTGIQMAGPKLSSASFSQGMFAYPRSGGTPKTPLMFYTREAPMAIKDFVEVFYDRNKSGIDERGLQGNGMVMKAAGGKRYELGQWDASPTKAFNDPAAIATSDAPELGGDPDHEQDGHKHTGKCLSCSG